MYITKKKSRSGFTQHYFFPFKEKSSAGFTLVEVLIVIAIIGIISSVAGVSLQVARAGARDASVRSNMEAIRLQSEIHYDNNSDSYGLDSSDCSSSLFTETNISLAIEEITEQSESPTCNVGDGGQAWAASAPLVRMSGHWCVDSTGRAVVLSYPVAGADCSLPPPPVCGNSVVEAGESCDSGFNNGIPGYCNATCSAMLPPPPVCGNSIVETGELCDSGFNNGIAGYCNATCSAVLPENDSPEFGRWLDCHPQSYRRTWNYPRHCP